MSIYREICKKNIDWILVEKEIKELGTRINDYSDDDSYLSGLYLDFEGTGDVLTKVTELFLKNGFDVNANGGRNGASCLHALNWSTYDHYVLETAELLLDAGTKTDIPKYDDDEEEGGVLVSIEWRLGSWMNGDYDTGNIFEAYYEMVDAYEKGEPYKGIRAFRECVGYKVEKIEKISFSKESAVFDVGNNDSFSDALIIWANGKPLVVSSYVVFIINPYIEKKIINRMDISSDVSQIIGTTISGLRFQSAINATLNFDNGYRLRVSRNSAWGHEHANTAHFIVDKPLDTCPIKSGTVVDSIILKSGIHWSETVYKYHEDVVVLNMGDRAYQVYSKGKCGENHSLRIEEIPKSWIGPVNRRIVSGKMLVDTVMLNENNQPVLIQLIDGNEKIYITVDKNYDEVIYARTGRTDSDEEVYISIQFEDNSEWAKQEFPRVNK